MASRYFQRRLKRTYLKDGLQGLARGYLKVTLRRGLRGGVSCFYSFGEPLKTWTYAMLMYSLPRHFTV